MADFAGAKAAIKHWLADHWSAAPIAWPNEPAPKTVGDDGSLIPCWIYGEITGTGATIRGVGKPGSQVNVDDGLIQLTAFVQADTGTDLADTTATALGEIFRVKHFYDAEPGACVRTWAPFVGGDTASAQSGLWVGVTVTIPFEFWHIA